VSLLSVLELAQVYRSNARKGQIEMAVQKVFALLRQAPVSC